MCRKNERTIKKQETQIKPITDNTNMNTKWNRIQNDLNQTKNEMKSKQKDLSGLIQKQQLLERKFFESQDNCSPKEAKIKQKENTLKQK